MESSLPILGRIEPDYRGKVRDLFIHKPLLTDQEFLIIRSSNRISAFDSVYDERFNVPNKGAVLNGISEYWATRIQRELDIPNAICTTENVSPLQVQLRTKPLKIEAICRGYCWGSLASKIEKAPTSSVKIFNGQEVSRVCRYEKFDSILFTPTTKGDVDEDIHEWSEFVTLCNGDEKIAKYIHESSVKIFEWASVICKEEMGLILVDSKFEWGMTADTGTPILIDEMLTPDSSRFVSAEEYSEKIAQIKAKVGASGSTVMSTIEKFPELKISEAWSKEYFRSAIKRTKGDRDLLIADGIVMDMENNYRACFERIVGQKFDVRREDTIRRLYFGVYGLEMRKSMLENFGSVVIVAGSDSDAQYCSKKLQEPLLKRFQIPSVLFCCSAHKTPKECVDLCNFLNRSIHRIIVLSVAGKTDALSGVLSWNLNCPVISVPPPSVDEWRSCVTNPPGSSNATILDSSNAVRFCAQFFGKNEELEAERSVKVANIAKATPMEIFRGA